MAKLNWDQVTKTDVEEAIRIFDSENPEHPEPRSTFLLYKGRKYPAKHIRGMAYMVHFGQEVSKADFSGGLETIRFFTKLGFDTQYTMQDEKSHQQEKPSLSQATADVLSAGNHRNTVPAITSKKSCADKEKITIPVKGVIEQKNALQLLMNRIFGGDVVCEKTYPWMKTPGEITGDYQALYNALVAYRGNKDFAKKNVTLRCDFVCESRKLIVEYDERQHFSEARRLSLLSYQDIPTVYDRKLWIQACADTQAKDNQPENRDEIRAYYDSVRDIEAAKHGYSLIRIMHGQINFLASDAELTLKSVLQMKDEQPAISTITQNRSDDEKQHVPLKIGLYLQTNDVCNETDFKKAMAAVKDSDIDILVLPEIAYTPFEEEMKNSDFLNNDEIENLYRKTLDLSEAIGRAVVICNQDRYGTIMSIYANAFASDSETSCCDYIKHTATSYSAFEIKNYDQYAEEVFTPILYRNYRIGLTICYDCNHSLFSRKYGLNGVDIIINSTGGNVVYDKWFKYNKARAIENHCFTFTTMGGPDGEDPHNYVFGFTPEGKEMTPSMLNGVYDGRRNISGGIYIYDTSEYDGTTEEDASIDQAETVNKLQTLFIPAANIDSFIARGTPITDQIRVMKHGEHHIVMCLIEGDDIMKPEKVLKLLYHQALKKYSSKKYLIVNRWKELDIDYYRTKLSLILKVRSMENYCAVILTSPSLTKCYQCGKTRNAQVVAAQDGQFGIDLERAGGPETIWKNKPGMMKAEWRSNVEWLINSLTEV